MNSILSQFHPDTMVLIGLTGLIMGILFFLIFFYRRILWLMCFFSKRKIKVPNFLTSLRNLISILLWTSLFAIILFAGLFLRTYQAFTCEKPVAQIQVQPVDTPQTSRVQLSLFISEDSVTTYQFLLKGDQWMLEGDIAQLENWLHFLGLKNRYRLTRIRGRYFRTQDEIQQPATIYSLVKEEDHPIWRFLYRSGQRLPFVRTVYGNAVFQNLNRPVRYLVFVGHSGLITKIMD